MIKNTDDKVYGIIGSPIGHSLSPYMQNAAFRRLKIKAVYLPFSVKKDKLKEAISSLKKNRILGFNVTIPFKSECMKYLDKVDPVAKMIGAVNTVVSEKRKFIGYNTDYLGFIRSLKEELMFEPKGKSVFILGAGGAARAVSFGLAKEDASFIYIYDIMPYKARSLSLNIRRFFPGCRVIPCREGDISSKMKECQLLVNCTPMGMRKEDPLPINIGLLHKNIKVYDIVYTPLKTKLVSLSEKKSIKAKGGLGMLLYQGAAAFELWTKKRAPVSVMRKALLDNLLHGISI